MLAGMRVGNSKKAVIRSPHGTKAAKRGYGNLDLDNRNRDSFSHWRFKFK